MPGRVLGGDYQVTVGGIEHQLFGLDQGLGAFGARDKQGRRRGWHQERFRADGFRRGLEREDLGRDPGSRFGRPDPGAGFVLEQVEDPALVVDGDPDEAASPFGFVRFVGAG